MEKIETEIWPQCPWSILENPPLCPQRRPLRPSPLYSCRLFVGSVPLASSEKWGHRAVCVFGRDKAAHLSDQALGIRPEPGRKNQRRRRKKKRAGLKRNEGWEEGKICSAEEAIWWTRHVFKETPLRIFNEKCWRWAWVWSKFRADVGRVWIYARVCAEPLRPLNATADHWEHSSAPSREPLGAPRWWFPASVSTLIFALEFTVRVARVL